MRAALPVEIIDLILFLSLQQDSSFERDRHRPTRFSQRSESTSFSSATATLAAEQLFDARQAIVVSSLSRHHRALFQTELYRHVTLPTARSIISFASTITSRPDLGTRVRSLAIFSEAANAQPDQLSGAQATPLVSVGEQERVLEVPSPADDTLSLCLSATHLLLSCSQFTNPSAGLYMLHRPKEVTLVNVSRLLDLEGLVLRHRNLTAAALQSDPRIQAILGSTATAQTDQPRQLPDPFSWPHPAHPVPGRALAPLAERSLSHLHLVHFDGRLLHHLATLASLTHLVLTHPLIPETRPGVPGLSIIPRSHLMLLLGSGNISLIVIRADLPTCIRIMEELAPINDRKLVFRPIRRPGDPLFPDQEQPRRILARLGNQASALHYAVAAGELDLLAEFYNRVRLHVHQIQLPASTVDPDTSQESSGRTSQGRSSDSSGDATSQSASTEWGDDEDADHFAQPDDDGSDSYSDDNGEESDNAHNSPSQLLTHLSRSDGPSAALPTRTVNAPPLNIPIEELLRSERFLPAGLVGQVGRSSPSQASSAEPSSASPGFPSSASSSPRRNRQRITRAPFAPRKTDLRGATQANIDVCAELYEALAVDAGIEHEINFW